MAGKGANGRGSVYQDKHGRWWAQLPPDEYKKRPKRSASTEAEAVARLAELEQERSLGLNPGEQDPTIGQHLTNWLEIKVKPNVKIGTYEDRLYFIDHYLRPHIGPIRVKKANPTHFQRMLNEMLERGLARSTTALARRYLIQAMGVACEWKLRALGDNPAKLTKIAQVDTDEEGDPLQRLTQAEAQRLLASLEGHRLYALYFLALTYGMRQAELVGLRWTDVDLERREIHIRTQVRRKHKEVRRTTPKSKKSRRKLLIDDETVAVLRQQAKLIHEERTFQQRQGKWNDHGLVFPSSRGTALFGDALLKHVKKALAAAGLPIIPFHGLRHTAANVMLEQGVMLADVSEILGHASPAFTAARYLKGTEDGKRRAAETMATLLRRATK